MTGSERYSVVRALGSGAQGELLLVRRSDSDLLRALKRFAPDPKDPDWLSRAKREAHLTSLLQHPSFPRVFWAGLEGERFSIELEFIAGRTVFELKDRAAERGRLLPPELSLAIIRGVLAGLAHAHALEDGPGHVLCIVHGDLSPNNLMVGYEGEVKIIDLGMSRWSEDGPPKNLRGTYPYVAPSPDPKDPRGDLYVVGQVLHELLTGHAPEFCKPVPPASSLNPSLPAALDAVLAKAMAPKPQQRYQTAAELRAAIDAAMSPLRPSSAQQIGEWVRQHFAREMVEADQSAPAPSPAKKPVSTRRLNDWACPRPFGRFTLLSVLGEGGLGAAFAADLHGEAELCVVKLLKDAGPAEQAETRERRFRREASALARLDHRNISRLIDAGDVDGVFYLAAEYITGRTVESLISDFANRNDRVPPSLAIHAAAGALLGLQHVHHARDENGQPLHLVHRDLGPANVMLDANGTVKLIDFGLVKTARLDDFRTVPETVLGTLAYMAPEQAVPTGEAPPVSAQSDIFSVAAWLYELLTSEELLPHSGGWREVAKVHLGSQSYKALPYERLGLPEPLAAALKKALERDPRERFASADAFREALLSAAAPLGIWSERDVAGWSSPLMSGAVEKHAELVTFRDSLVGVTPVDPGELDPELDLHALTRTSWARPDASSKTRTSFRNPNSAPSAPASEPDDATGIVRRREVPRQSAPRAPATLLADGARQADRRARARTVVIAGLLAVAGVLAALTFGLERGEPGSDEPLVKPLAPAVAAPVVAAPVVAAPIARPAEAPHHEEVAVTAARPDAGLAPHRLEPAPRPVTKAPAPAPAAAKPDARVGAPPARSPERALLDKLRHGDAEPERIGELTKEIERRLNSAEGPAKDKAANFLRSASYASDLEGQLRLLGQALDAIEQNEGRR